MRKIVFILLLSFLYTAVTIAQVPSQFIFSKLSKKEGLSANVIFQTIQDSKGFLWIAAQNGLQRYDGNRFLTFRHLPGDASSIPENTVSHLYIDRKNRLWLLFNKKIGIFNTSNFRFKEAAIPSVTYIIRKLMEDEQGRLIAFTDNNKRYLYNEAKNEFIANYPLPPLPEGFTSADMVIDSAANRYWLTGKDGLFLYDPGSKQYSYSKNNPANEPAITKLAAVKNIRYPFIAKDSALWLVSWIPFSAPPVLYCYDQKTGQLIIFDVLKNSTGKGYHEIWGFRQQHNGTMWVYGMGLLAYYNQATQSFTQINSEPFREHGIEFDFVSDVYEDREQNVWISTNKGLYRFNAAAQVFSNIQNRRPGDTATVTNAVSAVMQTKRNGTWVSTWGAGVFSYDEEWKPIANPVTSAETKNKTLHVSFMMQRRNEEIWLGMQSGGVKIYDPSTNKLHKLALPPFSIETVQQILEDSKGDMWIGTFAGHLVKCERGNWKDSGHSFKTVQTQLSDITKLYEDSSQHLWVCTANSGLYKMDINTGNIIKHYQETTGKNNGLLNNGATDIVQYNDSLLLIASNGLCILNIKTDRFRYLTAVDGLPSENIINIIVDKQKRLWLALAGGLYRLNLDRKLHVTYDANDGITNDIFEVSSYAVFGNGTIGMGTPHNFMVFDPEKTIDKNMVPEVIITGILSGGKYLPVDSLTTLGKLTLPYNNNAVTFELSTLTYRNRYKIYYMLEGLDKTWKPISKSEIAFPYLPPGSYTLKIKAENGEGEESKTVSSLALHVNAPFWKTWWFYTLVALAIGGLLFWLDRERLKRRAAVQKMRSDIAGNLHQEVNTALQNITILSEMAKIKADKDPDKSKEFIEQIHSKSSNMMIAMDDMLWSIDPDNDTMEKTILRMQEYIDALNNRNDAQTTMQVDENVKRLNLNMQLRHEVFVLFKQSLDCLITSGVKQCRIQVTAGKNYLNYTAEFNNNGCDIQQLIHLLESRETAKHMSTINAAVDTTKTRSHAVFAVTIPVS